MDSIMAYLEVLRFGVASKLWDQGLCEITKFCCHAEMKGRPAITTNVFGEHIIIIYDHVLFVSHNKNKTLESVEGSGKWDHNKT
ncbi:unnamed protein product [Dovyalis caffra]|uniref:Uncharacterized protein n=1 Tax=Dovyalis caffra TaxID=77055 RepID=A0AAV1QXQ1_9ROSI|nr:unnamed protein product [Dovyalis caffra]